MKRSRFTERQIAFALHQAEQGRTVGEIARKMGVTLHRLLRCDTTTRLYSVGRLEWTSFYRRIANSRSDWYV